MVKVHRRRFAGEEIYTLHEKVFGQLGFGRGIFVTIEALDDLAIRQTNVSRNFKKLCLRQSPANSGRPQIDIASSRQ
jgi:hypothetical protein